MYYSRRRCVGMSMCCEKMMTGCRNAWRMKQKVLDQKEDQRGPGERLSKRTVKHVDWTQRMLWIVVNGEEVDKGWVSVGECFFWYRPTRVVPDQRSLNGCVCVSYAECVCKLGLPKSQCTWLPSAGGFISRAAGFTHKWQRTVLLSTGYWGQNIDLSLGPTKQIRIHAVEGRGSPHIYTNL